MGFGGFDERENDSFMVSLRGRFEGGVEIGGRITTRPEKQRSVYQSIGLKKCDQVFRCSRAIPLRSIVMPCS